MRFTKMALVATCAVLGLLASIAIVPTEPIAATAGRLVLIQGFPTAATPGGDDIPAERRAEVEQAVREYVRDVGWYRPDPGPVLRNGNSAVPGRYSFYPMAGRLGRDIFHRNFVDLDPRPNSLQDFNCTTYTYDGHLGYDTTVRSFAEKDVGVPVYAALNGLVIRTDDGHYDENGGVGAPSTMANYVVIDHGNQQVAYYWHLKNGSVVVQAGDEVVAGQQIGQTASSGFSNWPHLHFETHVAGAVIEPSSGGCNPGESGWTDPIRVVSSLYLDDFGFRDSGMPGDPMKRLPWGMESTGHLTLKDPVAYFWFQVKSMPASAPWRAVFRRPNGSVAYEESGAFSTPFNRGSWWMFGFDVADMHEITGTWEMEFYLGGRKMGVFPVEVVQRRAQKVNRPPKPVKVRLWPKRPRAGEVLSCHVTADLLLDDPDYDVVIFRYEWTVNGEVVRKINSAAHSDVLRADALRRGDRVRCAVTPSDGVDSAPTKARGRRVK
ncbi:MAG: peptidoglycan DD-metalloendopeptidase family protein [Acidobacteria bacterium]|nr:peptidoglycan DD-metalloendopeptidase family protein [Acidobacteriota bacterium]